MEVKEFPSHKSLVWRACLGILTNLDLYPYSVKAVDQGLGSIGSKSGCDNSDMLPDVSSLL